MMSGFNFFTPNAKKVIQIANREAHGFNHNAIGTEHLLLGVASLRDCIVASVMDNLGLSIEAVRFEIEKLISQGEGTTDSLGMLPLTPRSKKILQFAAAEAHNMNFPVVDGEHILLAILREGEGVAAKALYNLGITFEKCLEAIKAEVDRLAPSLDIPSDDSFSTQDFDLKVLHNLKDSEAPGLPPGKRIHFPMPGSSKIRSAKDGAKKKPALDAFGRFDRYGVQG